VEPTLGPTRIVASLIVLIASTASGCYLSHPAGLAVERDAGPHDAGPQPDGWVQPDGAMDAGLDSGHDAGLDGGTVGRDAEPPLGSPPNPSTCRIEPEIFPFTNPIEEARWPDGPMAHSDAVHVCSTPVVIDLDPTDGLDDPVVIFPSYATLRGEERGILRIWNPRTRETVSYPPMDGELGVVEATGNVAAGDIDGDGRNEILANGIHSGTIALRHDGTLMWHSPFPTARDRGLNWARTIGTAVTLADLQGDGLVEVIAGRNVREGLTGERRFTGDSETTTRGTNEFLGPIACVADLDGDGYQEVIAGRTAFRYDGTILWNQVALNDGLCGVADVMPSNPGPEVVLAS